MIKKVYICSPYKGDVCKNIERARICSRYVYQKGNLPICVHIYLEDATGLHEAYGHRDKLLMLGIEMLKLCDECWVFGKKISEGMQKEIEFAKQNNIKIVEVKDEWKY